MSWQHSKIQARRYETRMYMSSPWRHLCNRMIPNFSMAVLELFYGINIVLEGLCNYYLMVSNHLSDTTKIISPRQFKQVDHLWKDLFNMPRANDHIWCISRMIVDSYILYDHHTFEICRSYPSCFSSPHSNCILLCNLVLEYVNLSDVDLDVIIITNSCTVVMYDKYIRRLLGMPRTAGTASYIAF